MSEAPLPGSLMQQTLEAMDDFIRRAAQAQRTSRATAPKDELNGLRLSYDVRSKVEDKGVSAREMIGEFTRVAQGFAETVLARRPGREWRRLQKSIARLMHLKDEHVRWEALRRLKSPPAKLRFVEFDSKMMNVNILPGSPPIVSHVPFVKMLDDAFRDVEKDFLSGSKG